MNQSELYKILPYIVGFHREGFTVESLVLEEGQRGLCVLYLGQLICTPFEILDQQHLDSFAKCLRQYEKEERIEKTIYHLSWLNQPVVSLGEYYFETYNQERLENFLGLYNS